jgi:predicted ester cyclase
MAAADEIYAKAFVAHWLGGPDTVGIEDFKAHVAKGRSRAPDYHETIDQIVAEGDLVVTRFTSRGTFASEPAGAAQPELVTMQEIAIHRLVAGKIVEQWTVGAQVDNPPLDAPATGGRGAQTEPTAR